MKTLIACAALVIVSAAQDAAAQGFVSPFVDTTLSSPSATGSSSKAGFGISFGNIGKIVGFETEIGYQPEVIDNSANALAKSRVIIFSGDVLIGPTIGGIKAYGAVGGGNLNLNVSRVSTLVIPDPESISNNYFTFNVGGGVMGFFTDRLEGLGLRAQGLMVDVCWAKWTPLVSVDLPTFMSARDWRFPAAGWGAFRNGTRETPVGRGTPCLDG